eukprot:PITA_29345
MMDCVEATLQRKGLPSKFYRQATIGPLFIKMSEDTSANVTDVRGWGNKLLLDEMPLQPQVTFEPFMKWSMDFVGPINPPSKQKSYIIVCTDYLTKWVETKAIKATIEEKVVEFLRENIFYKYKTSTPYHPQENGQVEVTNRALEEILTKVVSNSRKYWENRLVEATWANNTTWKTRTGFTPYELVYRKKALLSIEFEYNTLRLVAQLDLDLSHAQQERLPQLNGLDEQRMQALLHSEVVQLQRKIWHHRHLNEKKFQPGDWALLYDYRYKDFKWRLRTRWLGPYIVEKCNDNGSVLIKTIDEEAIPTLVNEYRLKIYRKPLSK